MKTPDEIKRYQKIISNKDAILADAQSKADATRCRGQRDEPAKHGNGERDHAGKPTEQANDLLERQTSRLRRSWIMPPTTPTTFVWVLSSTQTICWQTLEKIMSHTIEGAGAKYSNFINAIQSCYDIVSKNRSELSPQAAPTNYGAPETEESEAPAYDEQQPEEN